jgi:carboxyl-terminal processing protease
MLYGDIILMILELVFAGLLYLLAGYATRVLSSKWRLCYFLPAVICLLLVGVWGFEVSMLGVYLGSCLLIIGFFKETKGVRRAVSALSAAAMLISLPVCLLYSGYRVPNYVKDFEQGFTAMKEHYVLAEHKGIDWDALYEKYLPQFKAANQAHDAVANYQAWESFCMEFHDGHVIYSITDEDVINQAEEQQFGNDYGLALMALDDGRTVAVNVEPDSVISAAGIQNGTVITAWNGESIEDVEDELTITLSSFPDRDNEFFYRALLVAGVGEDSVTISYLDASGNEQSVEAPKLGTYYSRLEATLDILDQGLEAGHMTWTSLNEDTVCLRMKEMSYDSISSASGDHSAMQAEMREKLLELKQDGVTNLIIDLRSNCGGSGDMVKAIAELFAPEGEHYYATDAAWDAEKGAYAVDAETGKYIKGEDVYFQGENLWEGRNIILLVNAGSVSAADHMTKVMSEFDNVTVIGFTEPNGSAQGISCVSLESGMLSFSSNVLLDENGDIFIDSGVDRQSGDDIDIKIPFAEAAVKALFDDGEDYVMEWTLDYLEE